MRGERRRWQGEGTDTERTETRRNHVCRVLPASDDCFGISAALQSHAEAPQPLPGHPLHLPRTSVLSQGNGWALSSLLVVVRLVPNRAAPPGAGVDVQGLTSGPSLGDWTEVSPREQGWLQGRIVSPDTPKQGLLCLPQRGWAMHQLHQQLCRSRLLGACEGHWGTVGRVKELLYSG